MKPKRKINDLENEISLLNDLLSKDIYTKVIRDYDKILEYENLLKENIYLRKKNKELKEKLKEKEDLKWLKKKI